jgi:hypothetical protein
MEYGFLRIGYLDPSEPDDAVRDLEHVVTPGATVAVAVMTRPDESLCASVKMPGSTLVFRSRVQLSLSGSPGFCS